MSDDPLDALEAEFEEVEEEVEDLEDDDLDDDSEDDDLEEEQEASPPGYLSYEEWVAQGKDPDMYKGKKAYEAEYERIQEVKKLERTVKDMGNTLKSTVDAIAERDSRAEARHRKELEAALNQAKEDGDTDAVVSAFEELNELNARPKPQEQAQTHPVISDFIDKNPILEKSDINAEFARIYNGKLKADGVGPTDHISDAAISGYARAAMASVKSLFPERFESPRNQRQTIKKTKAKPAAKVDVSKRLRETKLVDVAPQNRDATFEIYEMIKAKDPKAAETFAKNMLGD